MTKPHLFSLIILCLFLLTSTSVFAINTTLAWDENLEPNIVGYKLYYQSDSSTLPLEGVGANEGASPIDVGNATSFSITGLPDNQVTYFAVTAYDDTGAESTLSNIIASSWIPKLIAPINASTDEPSALTFIWEAAPLEYGVTYTLYYGTDPQLAATPVPLKKGPPESGVPSRIILTLMMFSALIVVLGRCTRKSVATGVAALTLSLTLAGCGGAGGNNADGSQLPTISPAITSVVFKDVADFHEAYDLKPSTTYYWKVVALDVNDPNLKFESVTNSFTTAAF